MINQMSTRQQRIFYKHIQSNKNKAGTIIHYDGIRIILQDKG